MFAITKQVASLRLAHELKSPIEVNYGTNEETSGYP
jgi:hypothetical protein